MFEEKYIGMRFLGLHSSIASTLNKYINGLTDKRTGQLPGVSASRYTAENPRCW